tara:strand:+ start:1162 stop:1938 length:777 start_codon:yes stop_codon:yes gene_type:complete
MRVLVTGSSNGIGKYIANKISKKHEVIGLSKSKVSNTYKTFQCDLLNLNEIKKVKKEIFKNQLRIDALICAAGIQGKHKRFDQYKSLEWVESVNANIKLTFYPIMEFQEYFNLNERFKIICFSGGGATGPRENFSGYSLSKTSIVRMIENLSIEWQSLNIDINAVAPGAIYTNMTKEILKLGLKKVGKKEYDSALEAKLLSNKRLDKLNRLILFLLSEKSNGLTGRLLSAQWDDFEKSNFVNKTIKNKDLYTLRRITK